jgi:serine/threonine protein kinase
VHADALESHHALALRPGALLADRFRLVRCLRGTSPFAFSYQAEDQLNGDVVVVKEFFPRSLVSRGADGVAVRPHSPDDQRDFLRALHRFALEGAVLAEISHPNVVRVRAVLDANETVYLVMDHHETRPLAEYVQAMGGRVAPAEAGRIAQHLLSALELLHAESIIHRDLSPRTVHIRADGSTLLLEFSARRHLPVHATDFAAGFAAFEQYGTRDIGPWTDVYATAAVLYYLLTGVTPPSALERAAGEAIASPSSVIPELAPSLARVVLRGMSLLPQQRPHSASEFRRQLETSLVDGGSAGGRSPQAPQFAAESMQRPDDSGRDEDNRNAPLRLAAGGIVVPDEESGSAALLRKLKSAAARLRKPSGAATQPDEEPVDFDWIERRRSPVATPAAPTRAPAAEFKPAVQTPPPQWQTPKPVAPPAAAPPIATATVPAVSEASLAVAEGASRRFDIAAQIALATEDVDAQFTRPDRRRRYSLAAAAGLVLVVGGSLIVLARSGRASGMQSNGTVAPVNTNVPADPPAPTPTNPNATTDGAAVLQSASQIAASPVHAVAASPAQVVKHTAPPARTTPTNPATAEQRDAVLPAGRLPNVKVTVAGTPADLRMVPPEVLVDSRTRLTNGSDQAEQGDYVVARRTFRSAVLQLDSVATRYPDSQAIRTLRREIELADGRALQACTAENELRKRRGEEARACQ